MTLRRLAQPKARIDVACIEFLGQGTLPCRRKSRAAFYFVAALRQLMFLCHKGKHPPEVERRKRVGVMHRGKHTAKLWTLIALPQRSRPTAVERVGSKSVEHTGVTQCKPTLVGHNLVAHLQSLAQQSRCVAKGNQWLRIARVHEKSAQAAVVALIFRTVIIADNRHIEQQLHIVVLAVPGQILVPGVPLPFARFLLYDKPVIELHEVHAPLQTEYFSEKCRFKHHVSAVKPADCRWKHIAQRMAYVYLLGQCFVAESRRQPACGKTDCIAAEERRRAVSEINLFAAPVHLFVKQLRSEITQIHGRRIDRRHEPSHEADAGIRPVALEARRNLSDIHQIVRLVNHKTRLHHAS